MCLAIPSIYGPLAHTSTPKKTSGIDAGHGAIVYLGLGVSSLWPRSRCTRSSAAKFLTAARARAPRA